MKAGSREQRAESSNGVELWAPEDFWALTTAQVKEMCNGCGPGGIGAILVPDTVWGLSIQAACDIHDFMYHEGETIEDKEQADRVLLNNIVRIIQAHTRTWVMKWLRYRRAYKYFEAVNLLGGPYFWRGKNAPGELGRVSSEQ